MKIMVATKETQGNRKNDFCFCEENEIVRFCLECSREEIDGNCGCRRSLVGLETSKAATTMKIIEIDINLEELKEKILIALYRDGWIEDKQNKESILFAKEQAKELTRIANCFNIGDIIERRGEKFIKRENDL